MVRRQLGQFFSSGFLLCAFAGLTAAPARADAIADFYKGKDLRLIISSTVGGGYDLYARTISRHLGRHIPGNPTIIPQNMPGAGGIAAANHIYSVAPKDGSVIAAIQNTVPFEPFFDNKAGAVRRRQAQLARHADDGSGDVHRLPHVEDQNPARCADPGDDRGRRRRGLDAGFLRAGLQPDFPSEGAAGHRLSGAERNPAGDGERRGRGDALAVLVEPQGRAPEMVSGRHHSGAVSIWRATPSRAEGRAVRARPAGQRGRQDSADRRFRAARSRTPLRGAARHAGGSARCAARGHDGDLQGPAVHRRLRQATSGMRRSQDRRWSSRA